MGSGFVARLARPGGNVTGLSRRARELSGKQLEVLKAIVPRLSRVAVFYSSARQIVPVLKQINLAGGALGITGC